MKALGRSRLSPVHRSGFCLALLAAITFQPLAGATGEQTETMRTTRLELLYNNVVLTLRSGQVQYGLFIGVEEDALIVKVGSEERRLPRNELARLSLQRPSRRGSFIAMGALVGLYSGLWSTAEEGYISGDINVFGLLFYGSAFMAAGGGLGYLASLISGTEADFSFQEAGDKASREWERLRAYAAGAPSARRVYVSVQGGRVFFGPRTTYQDIHRRELSGFSGGYEGERTVNVLRQVRLTASIFNSFEAGLAAVRISEPGYAASKWEYSHTGTWPDFTSQSVSQSLEAHFSSNGYFALIGARLPRNRRSAWSVAAGLGPGAQRIDFGLVTRHQVMKNSVAIIDIHEEHSVRKTALSALVYGEASVALRNGLALGVAADIVFGPSEEVPPSSALGIAAHKVRFGNSSVGISLGYRF